MQPPLLNVIGVLVRGRKPFGFDGLKPEPLQELVKVEYVGFTFKLFADGTVLGFALQGAVGLTGLSKQAQLFQVHRRVLLHEFIWLTTF